MKNCLKLSKQNTILQREDDIFMLSFISLKTYSLEIHKELNKDLRKASSKRIFNINTKYKFQDVIQINLNTLSGK